MVPGYMLMVPPADGSPLLSDLFASESPVTAFLTGDVGGPLVNFQPLTHF